MTTDKADITTRLRQTRADMIGTDDEQHYWDCHEAADKICDLRATIPLAALERLTTEERDSLQWCIANITPLTHYAHVHAARLRGLLDRLSPIAACDNDRPQPTATPDCPVPDNAPKPDTTPPAWMARPYWVDPPSGHRYGFPLLYDPAKDGDMTAWMIRNGYPEHLARKNMPCTFTATTE